MKEYVVITGASSGIGRAITISLANMGYHVLAIGRNEIPLQRIKMLSKQGTVVPIKADLSQSTALDEILKHFNEETKVKHLIHCAATLKPISSLSKIDKFSWQENIDVNLKAPIFLTQRLTPHFNKNTRILFMGSDYASLNKIRKNFSAYAISKSALRSSVEYFRYEYHDIALIGYLNPGPTDTAIYGEFWDAIRKDGPLAQSPMPPSKPEAVAEFIRDVLECSSSKEFRETDWDYRNQEHHVKLKCNNTPPLRAKL